MKHGMMTLDELEVRGRTVFCRVDINSPVDRKAGRLRDTTRLAGSAPTVKELSSQGARVVLLAHQGGDLEYHNYYSTSPHAEVLSDLIGRPVRFVEDVCGPAARQAIGQMAGGDVVLLDNVRFMTEETTMFEAKLRLSPEEQADTVVVRKLAPLGDVYVCDAFAAVHRSQPTLVGFEELLPSAMGRLFEQEVDALSRVTNDPVRPCIFVLGGAKVEDAFEMMGPVLSNGSADHVLTGGLVANIMLAAFGFDIGDRSRRFLGQRGLDRFIDDARGLVARYGDRIRMPSDVAYVDAQRREVLVTSPLAEGLIVDIGCETAERYAEIVSSAGTVFANGPMGVFEQDESEHGTEIVWTAIAESSAYTVIGGGDSIAAVNKYGLAGKFGYVSTAGGGMVRFISGEELPVIRALKKAALKYTRGEYGARQN